MMKGTKTQRKGGCKEGRKMNDDGQKEEAKDRREEGRQEGSSRKVGRKGRTFKEGR